jgi:alkylation response protein AidB-like acyl-CoA dehydrogenase
VADDDRFRDEIRAWLAANAGPHAYADPLAWHRRMAAAGWTCLGWPVEQGGRGLPLSQQVIFHEEYARSGAPPRAGYLGEELLGPTLIAFGSPAQQARFLPEIVAVRELWCQGYSEPDAGSDLAAVRTSATLDGDEWVIHGQKIWTSNAQTADWCFLLARSTPGSQRHNGLSYLLVPMRQPGITVRPIRQITGEAEFNEVFFDGARTAADLVVGEPGQGWRVAMGTLGFERGVATLGQQIGFRKQLDALIAVARRNGAAADPLVADRLARARIGLEVLRAHALRTLSTDSPAERSEAPRVGHAGTTDSPAASVYDASVAKLMWARWHRDLGEIAMQVLGAAGIVTGDSDVDDWQRMFLFGRAETIFGGTDEIQRGVVAERILGLPRQARP